LGDIAWDQAFDEVARHIKKTRDESFIATDAQGRTVNRCESIAWNGGCTDTNEFNYLVVKSMRAMGLFGAGPGPMAGSTSRMPT
jgi:formate dehydrogenase major subunit